MDLGTHALALNYAELHAALQEAQRARQAAEERAEQLSQELIALRAVHARCNGVAAEPLPASR